jgi:fatty-acyl-CoA synthase
VIWAWWTKMGMLPSPAAARTWVIHGGVNIYPREFEEFLYGHPAVAEVHAFGVPDAFYGEELCACGLSR